MPEGAGSYPYHRAVEWLAHIPCDEFSQNALYEIGSAITLFLVRRYAAGKRPVFPLRVVF
mgnify:CR=1 FL=1